MASYVEADQAIDERSRKDYEASKSEIETAGKLGSLLVLRSIRARLDADIQMLEAELKGKTINRDRYIDTDVSHEVGEFMALHYCADWIRDMVKSLLRAQFWGDSAKDHINNVADDLASRLG